MVDVNSFFEDYLKDLKYLIDAPSVLDKEEVGAPFGKGVGLALDRALEISKNLGFSTYKDEEGYYGYSEIGQGDELVGILIHLDVVPAGNLDSWTYPPFDMSIVDNKVYGRGILDDKGPGLNSMYALWALIEDGLDLKKRYRFIFGTDEENLWRCVAKYKEQEEIPSYGFVPDSNFPMVCVERFILQCKLVAKNSSGITLSGGEAFNSVPSAMNIPKELVDMEILKKLGYEYTILEDSIKIIGKSAHVKACNEGISAIERGYHLLEECGHHTNSGKFIIDKILGREFGEGVLGPLEDEYNGRVKFNLGRSVLTEDSETFFLDIRIPVTSTKEEVIALLNEAIIPYGFSYEEYSAIPSINLPLDSKIAKSLMTAYQEGSGDYNSKPLGASGGTFARAFENFMAFGGTFPNQENLAHQPNEYASFKFLKMGNRVYQRAFELLNNF